MDGPDPAGAELHEAEHGVPLLGRFPQRALAGAVTKP